MVDTAYRRVKMGWEKLFCVSRELLVHVQKYNNNMKVSRYIEYWNERVPTTFSSCSREREREKREEEERPS